MLALFSMNLDKSFNSTQVNMQNIQNKDCMLLNKVSVFPYQAVAFPCSTSVVRSCCPDISHFLSVS